MCVFALTPSHFDRYQAMRKRGAIIIISSEHLTRLRISLETGKITQRVRRVCAVFFSLAIIRIIFSRVHLAGVKMINVCAFFGLVFIFTYLFCNALMFFFIYAGLDLISRLFHRETMFLLAVSVCVFFCCCWARSFFV